MSDISIIEFVVYEFIALFSLSMLISTVIKEMPTRKSLAALRAIFLLPGAFCAGILSSSGVNIITNNAANTSIIKSLNSSETWSQSATQTTGIVLQNPVWVTVHMMIFIVIVIYVITQILTILTKHELTDQQDV